MPCGQQSSGAVPFELFTSAKSCEETTAGCTSMIDERAPTPDLAPPRALFAGVPCAFAPFPDEIFGSWIWRVVVLNGLPTFNRLADALGIARCDYIVANPLRSSAQVDEIAGALQVDVDHFKRTLTTKPFWDAFSSPTKVFHGRVGVDLGRANRLNEVLLKACPECVEEDLQYVGWPYFRREHQLPVQCCSKHGWLLQNCCRLCARPFCAGRDRVILADCRCGARLHEIPKIFAADSWIKQAAISAKALNAARGSLDLNFLGEFLKRLMRERFDGPTSSNVSALLRNTYGEEGFLWLVNKNYRQQNENQNRPKLRNLACTELPPHAALAAIAACDVELEDVKAAIDELATRSAPTTLRRRNQVMIPNSTEEAKAMADMFAASGKKRVQLKPYWPFVFWTIFFEDIDWLKSWLGPRGPNSRLLEQPPSVGSDRLVILSNSRPTGKELIYARARAYARDRDWYSTARQPRRYSDSIVASLPERLRSAREAHMRTPGKPIKWVPTLAAKMTSTDVASLSFYRRNPLIADLSLESVEEFQKRLCGWAFASLNSERRPSVNVIYKLTGRNISKVELEHEWEAFRTANTSAA